MDMKAIFVLIWVSMATSLFIPNSFRDLNNTGAGISTEFIQHATGTLSRFPQYQQQTFGILRFLGKKSLPSLTSILPSLLMNFRSNYSNVCIYSKDPAQFKPRCFLCPDAAYGDILEACTPETDIQANVTYQQAECMQKNCEINYPEGGRVINGVRVKRHASNDPHSDEKPIMKLNPESSVKLELSRVNSFRRSSLPKQNESSTQMPIFVDPLGERFYEQQPEAKVQNLIVINNTEYIISRQDVFFAVESSDIFPE